MKKLLALSLLSLSGLGLAPAQVEAWWCCRDCSGINMKYNCTQYNAFSPCCCDGVNFQGCGFIPFLNPQPCAGDSCCPAPGCEGWAQGAPHLPPFPVMTTPPSQGPSAPPAQPAFKAPMPAPVNNAQPMPNGAYMPMNPQYMPYGMAPPANYPPYYGMGAGMMPGYGMPMGGPMPGYGMPMGGPMPGYGMPMGGPMPYGYPQQGMPGGR